MSQHTTKEILEMVAMAAEYAHINCSSSKKNWKDLFCKALHNQAASLPEEKVERKKPEVGETYLYIKIDLNKAEIEEYVWSDHIYNHRIWSSNRAYLMSERHLAEKKCEEVNKILNS